MTDGMRTIQVTEEEYEHLMRLRQQLLRRRDAGSKLGSIPGGRRSVEFGMGAVAGFAAYYLYKELFDEDDDEGDDDGDGAKGAVRGGSTGREAGE